MRVKNIVLFVFFLCLSKCVYSTNFLVEVGGNYSFFMAHRPTLQGYSSNHFGIYEFSVSQKTDGSRYWHKLYHNPVMGFTFLYSSLGKSKYTGNLYATLAYMQFSHIRLKHSHFDFKIGLGPGYVEKIFDRTTNYKNIVSSTHLNAAIQLNQSYHYHFNKNYSAFIGVSLTHLSNGSFRLPNLGINLAGVQAGVRYSFTNVFKTCTDSSFQYKKWHYRMQLNAGIKEVYPVLGPKYLLGNFYTAALFQYNNKSRIGAAVDLFKDQSVIHQMKYDTVAFNDNKTNLQLGIGLVHEVVINRLSLPIQAGFYVYNNYTILPTMYIKLGVNYAITDHWYANFTLKSHYAKADFFSYGIGIKL